MVNHIAFIMDGNRRYAKKNNKTVKEGYKAGINQFLNFVKYQVRYNIYETTFWALSTENWKRRNKNEMKSLYDLLEKFFVEGDEIEEFFYNNKIKIKLIGDIEEFKRKESNISEKKKKLFTDIEKRFDNYNEKIGEIFNYKVNVCINYGGHREILYAFNNIIEKLNKGEITKSEVDESTIKENIYFNNSKPPEVILRPGNVPRLSGFMSWDSAYSEIYFVEKFWPELTEKDFKNVINWFSNIQRNFGK